MLRSMTGYGRSSVHAPKGRFVVEIQSVNKKFLDIQVQMPRELSRHELELKRWIGARLARGYVNVKVFVEFEGSVPWTVKPNLPLVRQLREAWQQIAVEFGADSSKGLPIGLLAEQEDILLFSEESADDEAYRLALSEATSLALDQLIANRDREGDVLAKDLQKRIGALRHGLEFIAAKGGTVVEGYRRKLEDRLREITHANLDNQERILREIAIYADRIDISEELTRFRSHLDHFQIVTEGDSLGVGKTLDFIIQELARELNTMGSKAADHEVSLRVVDMKGELERIREQVQNVE